MKKEELDDFEVFVIWVRALEMAYSEVGAIDYARLLNMFTNWVVNYNARNKDEFKKYFLEEKK